MLYNLEKTYFLTLNPLNIIFLIPKRHFKYFNFIAKKAYFFFVHFILKIMWNKILVLYKVAGISKFNFSYVVTSEFEV